MLRRKQKEFAVESIMGMEQKTIGRIFFAETLIMGVISIVIGLFFWRFLFTVYHCNASNKLWEKL